MPMTEKHEADIRGHVRGMMAISGMTNIPNVPKAELDERLANVEDMVINSLKPLHEAVGPEGTTPADKAVDIMAAAGLLLTLIESMASQIAGQLMEAGIGFPSPPSPFGKN